MKDQLITLAIIGYAAAAHPQTLIRPLADDLWALLWALGSLVQSWALKLERAMLSCLYGADCIATCDEWVSRGELDGTTMAIMGWGHRTFVPITRLPFAATRCERPPMRREVVAACGKTFASLPAIGAAVTVPEPVSFPAFWRGPDDRLRERAINWRVETMGEFVL